MHIEGISSVLWGGFNQLLLSAIKCPDQLFSEENYRCALSNEVPTYIYVKNSETDQEPEIYDYHYYKRSFLLMRERGHGALGPKVEGTFRDPFRRENITPSNLMIAVAMFQIECKTDQAKQEKYELYLRTLFRCGNFEEIDWLLRHRKIVQSHMNVFAPDPKSNENITTFLERKREIHAEDLVSYQTCYDKCVAFSKRIHTSENSSGFKYGESTSNPPSTSPVQNQEVENVTKSTATMKFT